MWTRRARSCSPSPLLPSLLFPPSLCISPASSQGPLDPPSIPHHPTDLWEGWGAVGHSRDEVDLLVLASPTSSASDAQVERRRLQWSVGGDRRRGWVEGGTEGKLGASSTIIDLSAPLSSPPRCREEDGDVEMADARQQRDALMEAGQWKWSAAIAEEASVVTAPLCSGWTIGEMM